MVLFIGVLMRGYEEFKKQVYGKTKLDLSMYKERQMKRRIDSLISRRGFSSYNDYFNLINKDKEAFDEFIKFLTINVSEFYRNPGQWDVLKKTIIPEILKNNNPPKIWSAACSTGEEPYSLVMLMSEFLPLNKIKILACDFDEEAMDKAKVGIYSESSIKDVPPALVKKFFTPMGSQFAISDDVKKCVEFRKMNLLLDQYPKNIDLITCRNVMIYFTEEAKDDMYTKFYASLNPGGHLFVGSTEQIIQPMKYGYKSKKTFFYYKD